MRYSWRPTRLTLRLSFLACVCVIVLPGITVRAETSPVAIVESPARFYAEIAVRDGGTSKVVIRECAVVPDVWVCAILSTASDVTLNSPELPKSNSVGVLAVHIDSKQTRVVKVTGTDVTILRLFRFRRSTCAIVVKCGTREPILYEWDLAANSLHMVGGWPLIDPIIRVIDSNRTNVEWRIAIDEHGRGASTTVLRDRLTMKQCDIPSVLANPSYAFEYGSNYAGSERWFAPYNNGNGIVVFKGAFESREMSESKGVQFLDSGSRVFSGKSHVRIFDPSQSPVFLREVTLDSLIGTSFADVKTIVPTSSPWCNGSSLIIEVEDLKSYGFIELDLRTGKSKIS